LKATDRHKHPGGDDPLSKAELNTDHKISAIYNKYNQALQGFIERRLRSKEDAEDVAQEVYMRLIQHQKIDDYEPSFSLLRKIASNLMADRFRRQRVRHSNAHVPLDNYDIMSPDANPEQIVRTKEGLEIYKNVLNSLNKKTKQAFVLNRYKGLTYEQIAVEMQISIGMVRKHMSQALRQLRDGFESYI